MTCTICKTSVRKNGYVTHSSGGIHKSRLGIPASAPYRDHQYIHFLENSDNNTSISPLSPSLKTRNSPPINNSRVKSSKTFPLDTVKIKEQPKDTRVFLDEVLGCILCKKPFESSQKYVGHCNSKDHKKRVSELPVDVQLINDFYKLICLSDLPSSNLPTVTSEPASAPLQHSPSIQESVTLPTPVYSQETLDSEFIDMIRSKIQTEAEELYNLKGMKDKYKLFMIQMTLFDFIDTEAKKNNRISLPLIEAAKSMVFKISQTPLPDSAFTQS